MPDMSQISRAQTSLRVYEFSRQLTPPAVPNDDETLAALESLTPAEQDVIQRGEPFRDWSNALAKLRQTIFDNRQAQQQQTGVSEMSNTQINVKYRLADLLKQRREVNAEIDRLMAKARQSDQIQEINDYLKPLGLVSELAPADQVREIDLSPEAIESARRFVGI